MTPDHPNALWLREYYDTVVGALAELSSGGDLDELLLEHAGAILGRISPSWLMHSGGSALATTGDLAFSAVYGARLAELCGGDFRISDVGPVLADDHYGCARMKFGGRRSDRVLECEGMSLWRFESGLAAEHWEILPGEEWDDFFLGDVVLSDDLTARQYWLNEA